MFNLIIFGPPGCGKGTQSKLIAKEFDFLHLSTGELFREEIKKHSPLGKLLKKYIDHGLLVPDNITLREIYRYAIEHKKAKGIVFDGFPRTYQQAVALDKVFNKKELRIGLVISVCVNKEELIKRVMGRAEDSNRSDDTLEILQKRLEIYEQQTLPVIDYYKKNGNRLVEVDGLNPIKVVSENILKIIREHYKG